MAILQAIRHHIDRAFPFAKSEEAREMVAEMQAEDEALERRLQRAEEKAAEALALATRLATELDAAQTGLLEQHAQRLRAQELVAEELAKRIAIVDGRIDAVALAVELNRQGTAELLENIEERFESNRVDVSDRIDHVQQQVDQPDWRQRR